MTDRPLSDEQRSDYLTVDCLQRRLTTIHNAIAIYEKDARFAVAEIRRIQRRAYLADEPWEPWRMSEPRESKP